MLLVRFLFIFASTTNVNREHHLINVVCLPEIEPGSSLFQVNLETHYATKVARYNNSHQGIIIIGKNNVRIFKTLIRFSKSLLGMWKEWMITVWPEGC